MSIWYPELAFHLSCALKSKYRFPCPYEASLTSVYARDEPLPGSKKLRIANA